MTIMSIANLKGGDAAAMVPVAREAKAIAARHGAEFLLNRLHTGPSAGDWVAVLRCPDWESFGKCQAGLVADPEWQAVLGKTFGMSQLLARNVLVGIDL